MSQSNKLPILYSFRRCPYAIRARMTLHYSGINVELREIVLKNKPEHMLALSPKGTVPVLALNNKINDLVLEESLEIMYWALKQHDPDGWLLNFTSSQKNLISCNDEEFKYWLDRYKYPDRFPDSSQQESQQHCLSFLESLEYQLNSNQYLFGNKVSITDVAIFPFVRQYAFVNSSSFEAGPHPLVKKWMNKFLMSDLFTCVMLKYPEWKLGDDLTIF
ncbi:MAG: glutathione S-transferase [Pseudomonadota bacterium]|nr:glutathione S-transferase [Pseudomonadota bacterium]